VIAILDVKPDVLMLRRADVGRARRLNPALAVAGVALALLTLATPASAAPFGAATPIAGFGVSPSLAGLSSAAAGADGSSLVAATRSVGDHRQALVAVGRGGQLPVGTELLGPPGVITSQPRAVADDQGHGAVVFARGKTVYLSVCKKASCAVPVVVGSSALSPEPDVAVQPGSGRLTVIWRGRTKGGSNRLQWRITTKGKLGAVHTLREFGNEPRLGTDASGKTVAVWTRYALHPSDPKGLRTAARRVGEFTRPVTLQAGGAYSPQLVTGADGETIVAWLASPTFDVQSPRAQARVAIRTANRGFSAPADVGGADTGTLALDRAPDGHAVLALDRQVDDTTAIVQAAVRAPGGSFTAPQALAPPQFVSTAFGATAAIDDHGVATVAWSSGALTTGSPAGFFAARSDAMGAFAAPQQLSADPTGASQQHPLLTAAGTLTDVAWVTPAGPVVAQASG
jgi:hypothetical protein